MIFDILFGLILLLFLSVGLAWFISSRVIMQPREIHPEEWKQYQLKPEKVSFSTTDGLKLAGALIAGTNDATIILLHGYGRSKEQMLPQASMLNREGFGILIFDFRASGESEGKYITFGGKEQRDLVAAVHYLNSRNDIDMSRIGLLGFSMGVPLV